MAVNNRQFFKEIEATRAFGDEAPEERHIAEDTLIHEFLEHIRDTGGTHTLKAKLLLDMLDDRVSRWYA